MKKIVLVDDYADFLDALKEFVEQCNDAQCITFLNPLDALEYISVNKDVDILITDYKMPQMNGFVLAQKVIKEDVGTRIIISSGEDKQTLMKVCKQYDLDGKVEVTTKDNMEFMMHLVG